MKKILTIVIIALIYTGQVYADLTATEGLAIDLSSEGAGTDFTIAFDPTELFGNRTWGDASTDTIVWTWNRATGTDPTITFGDGLISTNSGFTTALDLIVTGGDITLGTTSIFSGGDTASLNNIDAIDATTETTFEAAIDALVNLTTVGTIGTGVWNGTAIDLSDYVNLTVVDLLKLTDDSIDANTAAIVEDDSKHLATNEQIYDFVIGLGYITEDPNTHDAVTFDTNMATVFYLDGQAIEVNIATPTNGRDDAFPTSDDVYDWGVAAFQALDANLTAIAAITYGSKGNLRNTGEGAWDIDANSYSLGSHDHSGTYEPADANLTSIAALTYGSTGFLRNTGAGTWDVDANSYQPADANLTTLSAPTAWRIFYSDGDSVIQQLALGTDGQYLKSNGATSAPTFDTPGGAGDMLKSTYDVAEDGYVDGNDTAYDATSWNGNINAPSMNAVRDKIEALPGGHDAVTLDTNMATIYYLTSQAIEVNLASPTDGRDDAISTSDDVYDFVAAWKLDDLASPEDNTDLNVSTSAHGLMVKLPDDATKVFDGSGSWVDIEDLADEIAAGIAENELADSIIVSQDIKDAEVSNVDVNWPDIDYLSSEGKIVVTDNESTAENNLIAFIADANGAGNQILETDGDLHYNPSTGTVTATEFVGGGAGLTSVDAATGDSATDFFDAGEIADDRISDTLTSSTCTGNAATATLAAQATKVTITDNDATNENNLIPFVSDANDGGGSESLETDTDLHYNPSTGTVTATEFVGGGSGLTSLDGENISNDTIDDDSIDFTDVTLADFVEQTAWRVFYSNGDGDVTELALGTDGQVLTSTGASTAPAFEDAGSTDVNDTAYSSAYDGKTTEAMSANVVYDQLHLYDTDDDGDVDTVDADLFLSAAEANEYIADEAGSMVTGNTETHITVTYQDADNTLDFVVSMASTDLTDTADLLYEAELDALSELTTQMADVTKFYTDDDIPLAGTDPDVDALGEISIDTDGANDANDVIIRTSNAAGTTQYALASSLKVIEFHIENPDDLETGDTRADQWAKVMNPRGMNFVIMQIFAWSDSDNYDFELYETNSISDFSLANDSLIDTLECDSNGTGVYYDIEVAFDDNQIAGDSCILFVHKAGTTKKVSVAITGYYDADVD